MDQRDAHAAAVRAHVKEVGELAHLVDLDLDARLLGRAFAPAPPPRYPAAAAPWPALRARRAGSPDGCRRGTSGSRRRRRRASFPLPSQSRLARCARRARACRRRAGRGCSSACGRRCRARGERIEDRLVPGVHQRSARLRSSALRIVASDGGGVDHAHARRLGLGAREVGGAHALEESAVLALEAVELLARGAQALDRGLVGAIEHQRAVGHQPRMRDRGESVDQLRRHALPRALVGGGGIGEAVADHPAARLERRADDARDVVGARGEDQQRLDHRRHRPRRGSLRAGARRGRCRRARASRWRGGRAKRGSRR